MAKKKNVTDPRISLFAKYFVDPDSNTVGNQGKSMVAAGYSQAYAKSSTKFVEQEIVQEAIRKEEEKISMAIDAAYNKVMAITIKTVNRDIGSYYRTEMFKDNDGTEHEIQTLIPLDELTPEQRQQIVDLDYKGARGVPGYKFLDTQTAMNNIVKLHDKYHGETDKAEDKSLEITLEGIKDKVTAKVKLIAQKNQESEIADNYMEKPLETTEEL